MRLPEDLYPYQKEDADRILRDGPTFLLLSEMGTGKTPTALAVSQLGDFKKTLILCPKTLQLEWDRQIKVWMGLNPSVSRRGCYRRLETLFEYELGRRKDESPFFILNYETFRAARHREILEAYPFDLIIMDEAHKLRNPRTKQTKGVLSFLDIQRHVPRLLLTGSPIVNNPADLHTLLCMVRPGSYSISGRMAFMDYYCYMKTGSKGRIKVTGVKNLAELRERTREFTVRRTKEEVLPYLPEKYVRKVILEMDDDQRDLYDSMERDFFVMLDEEGGKLKAGSTLSLLMRLRQLNLEPKILGLSTSSSKTEFLQELIDEMITPQDEEMDNGKEPEKLVVFSCFESYIRYLDYTLDVPHVTITGQESIYERQEAVRRFQEDPRIKVAIGTIQCMGEGITLTAASNVVIADKWWNPAVNNQAVDRLHRIGQKSSVQVIEPINEKSIDQSLDRILDSKDMMIHGFLQEEDLIREVIEDRRSESNEDQGLVGSSNFGSCSSTSSSDESAEEREG